MKQVITYSSMTVLRGKHEVPQEHKAGRPKCSGGPGGGGAWWQGVIGAGARGLTRALLASIRALGSCK